MLVAVLAVAAAVAGTGSLPGAVAVPSVGTVSPRPVVRGPAVVLGGPTILPAVLALFRRELTDGRRGQVTHHCQVRGGDRLVEADVALEATGVLLLVGLDQGDHHPVLSGPGGAARPVDVGLVILGRVVVDDRRHAVDVDTPGRHVGGHQGVDPAGDEVGQGTGSLALATSTVDGRGLHLGPAQLLGEPVGAVAGTTEDDGRPGGGHGLGGQIHPGRLVDRPEQVGRRGDVGRLLADLVTDRVALVVPGQLGDVAVQGG